MMFGVKVVVEVEVEGGRSTIELWTAAAHRIIIFSSTRRHGRYLQNPLSSTVTLLGKRRRNTSADIQTLNQRLRL